MSNFMTMSILENSIRMRNFVVREFSETIKEFILETLKKGKNKEKGFLFIRKDIDMRETIPMD